MTAPKYVNFITPPGIARWPHITEPDTKGGPGGNPPPDNKYKVNLILSDADTAAFKKIALDAAKVLKPSLKNPKIPLSTGKKDGVVSFIFKSHKKPVVFDAHKGRLPTDVEIGAGSKIRVRGSFAGYDSFGGGITAYLEAVQVIELRERFNAADGFDVVEDGFKATDAAPAEAAFGDIAQSSGDVLDL